MNRRVPLWVFLFSALLWVLFTVAFSWLVKFSAENPRSRGPLGKAAYLVASFPATTTEVFSELWSYASGDFRDEAISIRQDFAVDYSDFKPFPASSSIQVPDLLMKADRTKMSDGWRVLIGAFRLNGDIENAALLISPDLQIVRSWILDEVPVRGRTPRPKYRKFVHGFEILPNGSMIFAFDGGISLQKIDACASRRWAVAGDFSHAVTLDDTSAWTVQGNATIVQVAINDGAILRRISLDDVIEANPSIGIFDTRREFKNEPTSNKRNTPSGPWVRDRFHLNDVDALPARIANQFNGFNAGDLLVSARNLNLIFVLDPKTLQVKWWRSGTFQAQHDPDWMPNGEITVLDNRMGRDFSQIVSINPRSSKQTVTLEGKRYGFFTRIRGKHQLLGDGTQVITSSQQGRAFEVDRNGDVVFEVVNRKAGHKATNYAISELKWLPRDYFDAEAWTCPKAN